MPSRILREGINSSPRIAAVSPLAELFYRRLFAVVDDYGRYYANPSTLLGALWPTTPDRVCLQDVRNWLAECSQPAVNLLTTYEHRGAQYLQIVDFNQKLRSKSKFPGPASNLSTGCGQVADKMPALVGVGIRSSYAESESLGPAAAVTEPEPKNKPKPGPEVPLDELVQATANELHRMHAAAGFTPGPLRTTEAALVQVLADAVDPPRVAAAILAAHPKFLPGWRERVKQKPGAFVPSPGRWLHDGEYLHPPQAIAAAPVYREFDRALVPK